MFPRLPLRAAAGCVARALPSRWLIRSADALALLWHVVDGRRRTIANENLRAVFGAELAPGRRRHLARAAFRTRARRAVLEAAGHPLPLATQSALRALAARGAVVVTAAVGPCPAAVRRADDPTGDDGVFVPFLGFPTWRDATPARRAIRDGTSLVPLLCLPAGAHRYRPWVGPDLARSLPAGDEAMRVRALTHRVSRVVGRIARAAPEAYDWTRPCFARRPAADLGPYPAYSRYAPDGGGS